MSLPEGNLNVGYSRINHETNFADIFGSFPVPDHRLRFYSTDLVPNGPGNFPFQTNSVGRNNADDHWYSMVAERFITYVLLARSSTKSNKSPYGLRDLLNLSTEKYVNLKSSISSLGVNPQILREVVPEAVVVNRNDETGEEDLGIDYNQLIPVLINSIQEQQEQIDLLTKKLERLQ